MLNIIDTAEKFIFLSYQFLNVKWSHVIVISSWHDLMSFRLNILIIHQSWRVANYLKIFSRDNLVSADSIYLKSRAQCFCMFTNVSYSYPVVYVSIVIWTLLFRFIHEGIYISNLCGSSFLFLFSIFVDVLKTNSSWRICF